LKENKVREKGQVLWYDKQRKLGFIERDNGEHIFFHETSCRESDLDMLVAGIDVEFIFHKGTRGSMALEVRLIGS
jgi:cold shock CspA family protein